MWENKAEVRAWFEAHEKTLKETAAFFNIPYRTIKRWYDEDGWVSGRALRGVKDGLGAEVVGALAETHERVKNALNSNLDETLLYVPAARRENLLNAMSNEIIAEAMSAEFLDQQTIYAALIMKNEVEGLVETSDGKKDAPLIIGAAEKLQGAMIAAKKSIFGDITRNGAKGAGKGADLSGLNDDELREMIDE